MKKILALLLASVLVFGLAVTALAEEPAEEAPAVMTYEEYAAAELDAEVTVEMYVQATQSWWEDKITVYGADEDGAYFVYELACSEEDAAKLVPGTKIIVNGYKSEWSGEVEIADGTFEFVEEEGEGYIAKSVDVTALLGTDELIDHMNQFVSFRGVTVVESEDADGNKAPYLYNWDGSGEPGNDLYFMIEVNGEAYQFTVESYLCDKDSDVYKAVEALNVGDEIDMEGFLYWYNGPNPHITVVVPAGTLPAEEAAEGESPEGESPEGESPEGESPEGESDSAEGETPPEIPEGLEPGEEPPGGFGGIDG